MELSLENRTTGWSKQPFFILGMSETYQGLVQRFMENRGGCNSLESEPSIDVA